MTKLILAASAALLIAGPAFAETVRASEDAPTQVVSARGVDFANPAQVKQFYAKLRVAIVNVCASDATCAREVTAQAVQAANKPVLTALYNTQGDNNRAFAGNDQ